MRLQDTCPANRDRVRAIFQCNDARYFSEKRSEIGEADKRRRRARACWSALRSASPTQKLENSSPTCDMCAEVNVLCFNVRAVLYAAIEQNQSSARAVGTNVATAPEA